MSGLEINCNVPSLSNLEVCQMTKILRIIGFPDAPQPLVGDGNSLEPKEDYLARVHKLWEDLSNYADEDERAADFRINFGNSEALQTATERFDFFLDTEESISVSGDEEAQTAHSILQAYYAKLYAVAMQEHFAAVLRRAEDRYSGLETYLADLNAKGLEYGYDAG